MIYYDRMILIETLFEYRNFSVLVMLHSILKDGSVVFLKIYEIRVCHNLYRKMVFPVHKVIMQ